VTVAAATYRIGPSDFFTPGDLQADADTLDGQIATLDTALDGNEAAPQDWWDAFQAWRAAWKKFYSSTFGGFFGTLFASFNDANRDQLISFENQFVEWVHQAAAYGAAMPGTTIEPSQGSHDTLGDHIANQAKNLGLPSATSIVIVALVLIALLWVAKS
jgi:hypothetical protein